LKTYHTMPELKGMQSGRTVIIYTAGKRRLKDIASSIGAELMYMYRISTPQELLNYDNIIVFYSSAHGKKISGNYDRFLERNAETMRNAAYIIGIPYGADISTDGFDHISEILGKEIEFHRNIPNVSNELRFIANKDVGREFSEYMIQRHGGAAEEIEGLNVREGTLYVYPFRSGWEEGGPSPHLGRAVGTLPLLPATLIVSVLGGTLWFFLYSYLAWMAAFTVSLLLFDLTYPSRAFILYKYMRNRDGTVRDIPKIRRYKMICRIMILILTASTVIGGIML